MTVRANVLLVLSLLAAGEVAARQLQCSGPRDNRCDVWNPCLAAGRKEGWEFITTRRCCQNGFPVEQAVSCNGPWLRPEYIAFTEYERDTDRLSEWNLDTFGVGTKLNLRPRIFGNALYEPSVEVAIGSSDATLTIDRRPRFEDDALLLSAGGDAVITPSPQTRWSFAAGARYRTLADTDADYRAVRGDFAVRYSLLAGRLTPSLGASITRSSVSVALRSLGYETTRFERSLDKEEITGAIDARLTDALSARFELSTDGNEFQGGASLRWQIRHPGRPTQPAKSGCVVDADCPFGWVCDIDEPCAAGVGVCIRGCRHGERPCEAGLQCYDVVCKTCPCPDLCDQPQPCEGECDVDVWVDDTPIDHKGPADTGKEPDPGMIGKDFWKSRAIWVLTDGRSCADTNRDDHQNPEHGSPAKICVQVVNIGEKDAALTPVEVYWANASTAQAWGGGGWKLAGSAVVQNIWSHGVGVAEVPWNSVPDPKTSPLGHFCLVARLLHPDDPMTHPETADLPLNVVNNNNIAWRNVTVIDLLGMTTAATKVIVRNLEPRRATVDLTFRSEDGFVRDGGRAFVDLGTLFTPWQRAGGGGRNVTIVEGSRIALNGLPAVVQGIPMEAKAESVISIDLEARQPMNVAGTSKRYAFDVVQSIDGKEAGGMGYSVIARGRDAGRPCTSGRAAVVRGLHYPIRDFPTCAAATAHVESPASRTSAHFRSACAGPVLGARVLSCTVSPPQSRDYVVVDVEACCGERCPE